MSENDQAIEGSNSIRSDILDFLLSSDPLDEQNKGNLECSILDVGDLFNTRDIPCNPGPLTSAGSVALPKTSNPTREKNKRAQKRFRERRKAKLQEMKEQLELITEEMSRLTAENSDLMNRSRILEQVLCFRDEHVRFLQDEQRVFDSTTLCLQGTVDDPSDEHSATVEELAAKLCDPALVTSKAGSLLVAYWKMFVRELSLLLATYDIALVYNDSKGKEEALTKIAAAVDKGVQVCMQTAILHPTSLQVLITATLDNGKRDVSADDTRFWTAVVDRMKLTQEQEGQIVSLKEIFLSRMEKIESTRQRSLGKLHLVGASKTDRRETLQSVVSETIEVKQATQEVKHSLFEEHMCAVEFLGTILKNILSPLQKARCIVESYPFYPDAYHIASVLSQEPINK